MASASSADEFASRSMRKAISIVMSPTVTARRYHRTGLLLAERVADLVVATGAKEIGQELHGNTRRIDVVKEVA